MNSPPLLSARYMFQPTCEFLISHSTGAAIGAQNTYTFRIALVLRLANLAVYAYSTVRPETRSIENKSDNDKKVARYYNFAYCKVKLCRCIDNLGDFKGAVRLLFFYNSSKFQP